MITKVVVPWHNPEQLDRFLLEWNLSRDDSRLILQQDKTREGCSFTKNKGIIAAMKEGAEIIVMLDDDCFPNENQTFGDFVCSHENALEPQDVEMFTVVTEPPSRGTPYFDRTIVMPVAASMGFWTDIGDYDAPSQLVHGASHPMKFRRDIIYGRYFPLCGMNLSFRVTEWPWCQFIHVERFDDIWQGFLWQRKAYSDGKCFNLAGPLVRHSRQSNVWNNLVVEAPNLKRNETIWKDIHRMYVCDYEEMKNILKLSFPRIRP
tara:strand:- start:481 stop:1266 length:786 start_codon:yes stop_codon:yes gene_type:complete